MKQKIAGIFLFSFAIFLASCEPKTKTVDENLKNIGDSVVAVVPNTADNNSLKKPDSYTQNPIYLSNNKIHIDSLSPFYKYKNIERLDLLCEKLKNWNTDSLKKIVFPGKKIKFKHKADTISLGDYQFLVGGAKIKNSGMDYIILLDYCVEWGHEVLLVSVDKNHCITDIQGLGLNYGDGGESYERKIYYKDFNTYTFTEREENWVSSETDDTLTYNTKNGVIVINSNGTFKKIISKKSGNVVEIRKVKR